MTLILHSPINNLLADTKSRFHNGQSPDELLQGMRTRFPGFVLNNGPIIRLLDQNSTRCDLGDRTQCRQMVSQGEILYWEEHIAVGD